MRYVLTLSAFFCLFLGGVSAQQMLADMDNIRSMEMFVNGKKMNVPYVELGSRDVLEFAFDDLTKEYCRYIYLVEHCDFSWKKTARVFESDYLRGSMRRIPIDNYAESLNTSVDYTHYSFSFPNSKVGIVYSGNYRIRVINDEDKKEVCSYCFSVVDTKVGLNMTATTNTEIDWNKTHQQLNISLRAQNLPLHDSNNEIKVVVVPNGEWDKAVWNPSPDYTTPSEIKWEHCRELIFDGNNEFRKFEMTSVKVPRMGVDNIKWFRPYYHATLFPGAKRKNYVYDEDQNGMFYVRTTERSDSNYEADYVMVHFLLEGEPSAKGDYYVYGGLTNWAVLPEAKMEHRSEEHLYEAVLLLKEGYYNYKYVFVPYGNTRGESLETEGSFYQTENEYTVLVYYTPKGGRYDQLVGARTMSFHPSQQ